MRIKELREKTKEELEGAMRESSQKLHDLRFQLKSGKVKNPHTYGEIKRDIARIKTLLNDKG